MARKILVLSNMYPSVTDKSYGRFVEICVKGLLAAGLEVEVVGISKRTGFLSKLSGYLRFALDANFRLLTRKYDCVYIHHPLHTLLAAFPGVWLNKGRVALNFHGHDLIPVKQRGIFLQRLVGGFFSKAAIVITPSEHFKRVFEARYPRPAGGAPKVFYSGGVSEDYFVSEPPPLAQRQPSALFLSRLVEEKGWREFLRIAIKLKQTNPDMVFTVAGIGPDARAVHAEMQQSDILGAVTLVESSTIASNLDLYNSHRYFIFPTRFDESLALVNLEAMARGCVVFSSDFPTAAEYIQQGVNGYRFGLSDFEQEVASGISRLEASPEDAARIAENARADGWRFRESVIMRELPSVLEVQ